VFASSETYPARPVRIVTTEVGGSADFNARLIAEGIAPPLGEPVVVENRAGDATTEVVVKAAPDGYTMLAYGSTVWLLPFMNSHVTYDPVRDLVPVAATVRSPGVLVVSPSLPVKTVADLIALAKAKPGQLNYARGGTGSPNHLAPELFEAMAGVSIVGIPYRGGGPALNALVAGEVQMMINPIPSVVPLVNAGRLRAIAVSTAQPSALLPGLPTIAQSGLPGYEASSTQGIFVPAHTPGAVIARLNREIVRALNTPAAKEKVMKSGAEVAAGSPEEFAALIKSEMTRLGRLIRERGIRTE
jgi:tripartite-type tricarboxylate transporter receptor subunit TctC